jgi:hypothetical protein
MQDEDEVSRLSIGKVKRSVPEGAPPTYSTYYECADVTACMNTLHRDSGYYLSTRSP